ncbi:aminopeptidase [Cohnella candidum]|uniref:aminopeptidase n=1 Tax=Cohnella candidum TaxID=2674991 RepID=UPI0013DDAED6|nr:aminopeptidase [Cohnella candidum]
MAIPEKWLDSYCDVILKVGLNLQPGQPIVIGAGPEMFRTPIESRPFIHRLTQRAYDHGASEVEVHWFDPVIARLHKERGSVERLAEYDEWKADRFLQAAKKDAAFIMTYAPDPSLYNGIAAERLDAYRKAELAALAPFRRLYHGTMEVSWTVASVVTTEWASRVFPEVSVTEAKEKLWGLLLKAVRADQEDPIAAWEQHLGHLRKRQQYMNDRQFKELRYEAPGTRLTVGLPDKHLWISGATTTNGKGIPYSPNVPTEEIFTSPDRSRTSGTVRSTLPLSYGGRLIRDLAFRFEQGKIVEATADLPADELASVLGLDHDEGARYLGEIALVPQRSPIAELNTVFYNTLFDENASCHLAFGGGFPTAIEGGAGLPSDEVLSRGVNVSAVHVDFMMGSSELQIDGVTAAGEIVPLFRNGNWVV